MFWSRYTHSLLMTLLTLVLQLCVACAIVTFSTDDTAPEPCPFRLLGFF